MASKTSLGLFLCLAGQINYINRTCQQGRRWKMKYPKTKERIGYHRVDLRDKKMHGNRDLVLEKKGQ